MLMATQASTSDVCLRRLPLFYLVLNQDTVLNSYILLMFCVKIVGYRMNVLLKCRLLDESVTFTCMTVKCTYVSRIVTYNVLLNTINIYCNDLRDATHCYTLRMLYVDTRSLPSNISGVHWVECSPRLKIAVNKIKLHCHKRPWLDIVLTVKRTKIRMLWCSRCFDCILIRVKEMSG